MSEYHRLTDQKYSEAEYLFQTIEMANPDEDFDVDVCSTPPSHTELEFDLVANDTAKFFFRCVKMCKRPRRRNTVSHGGGGGGGESGSSAGSCAIQAATALCANGGSLAGIVNSSCGGLPPAPPSTPTSLTPTNTSLSSSLPNSSGCGGAAANADAVDHQRLNSLLYILDYGPKYKKKLKEQQRTDAELAELFNAVTITATNGTSSSSCSKTKIQPERGVSTTSRTIRKNDSRFKIRHNLKKYFRDPDEEDSVSAPEYDTEEEDNRFHRIGRIKSSRYKSRRHRRFARFEHSERMEAMVDIFDEAMNFKEI